ncbi:hypothetical protein P3T35_003030 [Kitasatospora sp. GP30]|uniref:hypothetical protein n=1 Tax=Kitasatospora sp. GP30 TaxID=3035084 RepID=UPI00117FDE78|nr:hypothetical protein [Kitasatospora sp. GP30]MDH6141017.1 hypothetical protein [Kitasatospora sp. GP30]
MDKAVTVDPPAEGHDRHPDPKENNPVIHEPNPLAERAWTELDAAAQLTTEQLERLIGLAGRNYGPDFLYEAYGEGKVGNDTVRALVGAVWTGSEYPDRLLDHDTWRWLFQVAGFTVDGQPAERPTRPVELWRGSVPERRTDWSWSTDRAVAEKFAAGTGGRPPGRPPDSPSPSPPAPGGEPREDQADHRAAVAPLPGLPQDAPDEDPRPCRRPGRAPRRRRVRRAGLRAALVRVRPPGRRPGG